jgi:hypothetical protein
VKGTNKFLSVFFLIAFRILRFEELLEINMVKSFFHSRTHSDFWSFTPWNHKSFQWTIAEALIKVALAENPSEEVKIFKFLSIYIWSVSGTKEIFGLLFHHSVFVCDVFQLWFWLKMWK